MRGDDPSFGLNLTGYVPLTDHGFALPCYSSGENRNICYVAECSTPFSHGGRVVSFDPFVPENLLPLSRDDHRYMQVGDFWVDVFLWRGRAYVGTPAELLGMLTPQFDDIAKSAPLSLLDLFSSVGNKDNHAAAKAAYRYLSERFGQERARRWRNEDYFLRLLRDSMHRTINKDLFSEHLSERQGILQALICEAKIQECDSGKISINIPKPLLRVLRENGRLQIVLSEFSFVVSVFGLGVQRVRPMETLRGDVLEAFVGSGVVGKVKGKPREDSHIDDVSKLPLVRAVLRKFPGARIVSLRKLERQ